MSILLCIKCWAARLFTKPIGFTQDGAHNRFFQFIDSDDDGIVSKQELFKAVNITQDIYEYLMERRKALRSDPDYEPEFLPCEGLSYEEFMWFYRESDLFDRRMWVPPAPPRKLYSFPSWPGMRKVPLPELQHDVSPLQFWKKYVEPHRSVVIRNALKGSTALEKWSDPEYLVEKFGDLEAKIEQRMEARGDFVKGRKPVKTGRAKIRDIVEGKIDGYVVSVVPQPMAWEITAPKCVLCGKRDRTYLHFSDTVPFLTGIEETSLWMSRGRTRSQFHYDKENTFNCLVSGKPKDWVIMDTRVYSDDVPWARGGAYNSKNDLFNMYTDWVGVDVDNLDLSLHDYLTTSDFQTFTQYPGDCVFLPYSMLHFAGHAVDADDDFLQVAVSYMWLPDVKFDAEACPDNSVLPNKPLPLAVFDTMWYYSGYGTIPQGLHDPRMIAESLIDYETGGIRPNGILGFLPQEARSDHPGFPEVVKWMQVIEKLVNNNITVPTDVWLQLSAAADLNALGANPNTTYITRPLEEINRMLEFFRLPK